MCFHRHFDVPKGMAGYCFREGAVAWSFADHPRTVPKAYPDMLDLLRYHEDSLRH